MTRSSSLAMRKNDKGYGFLSFARKYKKQLLDTGLDAVKKAIKRFNCIKIFGKQWIEVNDLSSGQCSIATNTRFKTSILNQIYVVIVMHILL